MNLQQRNFKNSSNCSSSMYTYKVLHFFYYRSKLTPSNQINPCTLICKYLHLDRVNRLACETTFHFDAKSV